MARGKRPPVAVFAGEKLQQWKEPGIGPGPFQLVVLHSRDLSSVATKYPSMPHQSVYSHRHCRRLPKS